MEAIKKSHNKENPFTDRDFPYDSDANNFHWVRPHQIVTSKRKEPVFISGGASTLDISQGALGDCWFLAAVQVFINNEKLANNLLCLDRNSFKEGEYCGAFVFKFWRYGEWIDVIIDDTLPCRKTRGGRYRLKNLKVGKSGDEEEELNDVEFWPCLVEKAYAKLKGGYKNIEGGLTNEAFTDLCGATGRTESLEQDCDLKELFSRIENHLKCGGFVTCSANGHDSHTSDYGIVGGHAYSVTRTARAFRGSALLLSIRNPWGRTESKNLPYSDDSNIWKTHPKEKKRLQKKLVDDGEFFMEISNFVKFFQRMTVSFMENDNLCSKTVKNLEQNKKKVWNEIKSEHAVLPLGSGWRNRDNLPRINFTLPKKSKCIISFCIKNRRKDNIGGVHTGFCIFDRNSGERVFSISRYEGKTAYENMRIVELEAGDYEMEPKSLKCLDKDYECFGRVWMLSELEALVDIDEPRSSFSGSSSSELEEKKEELMEIYEDLLGKMDEIKDAIENL